tara:strand:+ start:627 stop:1004 length:378 start_codon:yes stop_codon:yes gene_type:complete
MKNLIIDAASEKIFFLIITKSQSYTTTHPNSRENFDRFITLLSNFLKINKTSFDELSKIFVNMGPGKLSGIKISISAAKAISLSKGIELYGFKADDIVEDKYEKLLEIDKKNFLINNLIKPLYSS